MIVLFLKCLFGLIRPRTLAEWLDKATWYLIPSAQSRIRAEIEAHYAEAVHSHLADGASEVEAQAAALKELGNAKAANRRFRRKYLTPYDVFFTCRATKYGRDPLWIAVQFLQLLAAWIIAFSALNNLSAVGALLLQSLVFVGCGVYVFGLTIHKNSPVVLQRFFLAYFLQFLTGISLALMIVASGSIRPFDGFLFSMTLLSAPLPSPFIWVGWILLRKKLLTADEDDFAKNGPITS